VFGVPNFVFSSEIESIFHSHQPQAVAEDIEMTNLVAPLMKIA